MVLAIGLLTGLLQPEVSWGRLAFPDLRPLPPTDVHLGTMLVDGDLHYLVRFSTHVVNQGEGPLELRGTRRSLLENVYDVDQWIYGGQGEVARERVGIFYYHDAPGHFHYHFDDFGEYQLWSKGAFARAAHDGFASEAPLARSEKISFCVTDSLKVGDGPDDAEYDSCAQTRQGLSRGWADLYRWTVHGQWIDLGTTLPRDGMYVLRLVADPTNKLFESPGRADPARESQPANSAIRYVRFVKGQLTPVS